MRCAMPKFDVDKIRQDFPILQQEINGHPLVYLDNAATLQKPLTVINAIRDFYLYDNANVHRGVHQLSERATAKFEGVRQTVAQFINAQNAHEIIFTKGTTESLNLVAESYGRAFLKKNDEIIISMLEHHSNIVPWQRVAEHTGALLKIIPINAHGELCLDVYEKLLSPRTKIVAINHISNAIGTINPVSTMIAQAHAYGAVFLIDGAQAAGHIPLDMQALDCDFYAFTGHKIGGPT